MAVSNPYVTVISGCQFSFSATVNGLTVTSGRQPNFVQTQYVPTAGAASEIDVVYVLEGQTVNAVSNTTLDLTTAFESALTGIKYVAFIITGTTGQLQVGGTTANVNSLWFANSSDGVIIYPGGPQFSQGHPTTYKTVDASNKAIYLANAHATQSVTYTVVVGGKIT